MDKIIETLSKELNVRPEHAGAVVSLLDEGNTVPFIARYRKEQHGTMDDQTIRALADRLQYLRGLEQRKNEVIAAVTALEKLTPELESAVMNAATMAEVEDLYRPYRPKRRTRASIAREKGLEPLAKLLFTGLDEDGKITKESAESLAGGFVDPEKDVNTVEEAIQGAKDIIAEDLSDDAEIRKKLRERIQQSGALKSSASTEEDTVYRLYYDFQESLKKLQSHQILAMDRGEREGVLKVSVLPGEFGPVQVMLQRVYSRHPFMELLRETVEDAWDRLIFPSLEREIRKDLTERAQRV